MGLPEGRVGCTEGEGRAKGEAQEAWASELKEGGSPLFSAALQDPASRWVAVGTGGRDVIAGGIMILRGMKKTLTTTTVMWVSSFIRHWFCFEDADRGTPLPFFPCVCLQGEVFLGCIYF